MKKLEPFMNLIPSRPDKGGKIVRWERVNGVERPWVRPKGFRTPSPPRRFLKGGIDEKEYNEYLAQRKKEREEALKQVRDYCATPRP